MSTACMILSKGPDFVGITKDKIYINHSILQNSGFQSILIAVDLILYNRYMYIYMCSKPDAMASLI